MTTVPVRTARPWWSQAFLLVTLGFAAFAGTQQLRSFDLFWHLATGRYVVDHRALPATDPFRFTSNHAPWVDHSWLSQLALYGVEHAFGSNGLVVLGMLVAVAIAAILFFTIRRYGVAQPVVSLIVVGALFGARPRLMVRPELATIFLLTVLLALLERYRAQLSWKRVGILAALVVLWANLHAGVLIAPLVTAAFLLGCRLQRSGAAGAPHSVSWPQVLAVPAILAVAVLATPAGTALYALPLRIQRALEGLPVVNPEWMPPWSGAWQAYAAGVAVLVACIAWAAIRTRKIDAPTALVALLLAVLAASGARHQGVFFIGAAFAAGHAAALLPPLRMTTVALIVPAVVAAWCVAPPETGLLRSRQEPARVGFGIEPGLFPESAVRWLDEHPDVGPLYNDVAFGGYLIWRMFPGRQVFLDGRNEVDPEFLRQVTTARTRETDWLALLERQGVDAALVHYRAGRWKVLPPSPQHEPAQPVYRSASQVHFPRERFLLVQWDDGGMLFVRRTKARELSLRNEGFFFVHPEAPEIVLDQARSSPDVLQAALAELDRRDRLFGPCKRSETVRAELLRLRGSAAR